MAFPPMMLNSTLPGVVMPLSMPASPASASASAYSRPQADSSYFSNLGMSDTHLSDILFHSAQRNPSPSLLPHSRHSSNASSYSLASPADSPPSASSANPSKQSGLIPRTTIRRARTATSPYPREPHIHSGSDVYSSSSEAEDLQMYLPTHHHHTNQHQSQQLAQDPYAGMYIHPSVSHIDPMQSVQQQQQQQHHHLHQPVASSAAPSQYGRIAMSPDHNLEQLASNVRSATTTSASDRAKQIFVHAW